MEFPYQDMLELPHHVSRRHPPMPLRDRAAQFAPFAALTGYAAILHETARVTEARRELTESARALLDARLAALTAHLTEQPRVEVEHFVADAMKAGGKYVCTSGRLVKVDTVAHRLLLADGTAIAVENVLRLDSPVLDGFEFED